MFKRKRTDNTMFKRKRTDNTMFKRKRIKGQITIYKHFTENSSSRNTNPTKKLGVISGVPEGLPCHRVTNSHFYLVTIDMFYNS